MKNNAKTMNVGIIGCGGFVQGNHLPNTARNHNLRIRALCDLNEKILAELKEKYNPDYVTTDFRDIARDKDIRMVIIGTPPSFRVEPIKALAESGKHIYVEKPMSLGYKDSKEIVDIVRKNKIKLQVGFNRPYSRIMQEAKRIFKKIRKEDTLIYYRIVGESILWPRFHQNDVNSGKAITIIHETTHIFNLLNWLLDQVPLSVYAVGGQSDNNIITFTYSDKTCATILQGGCGTEAYPKERMEIFTDNKVLVMNEFISLECTRIPGENDQSFPLKSDPVRNRTEGVSWNDLRNELMVWRDKLTEEQIRYGYYYANRPCVNKGHYDALQAFYEAIINDTKPFNDEQQGALATIIGLEAVNSLRTGNPVKINCNF